MNHSLVEMLMGQGMARKRFKLQGPGLVQRVAYAFLFVVLGYVCFLLAAAADLDTRIHGLRYWVLAACGVYAVAVPHVLLPDPHVLLLQRLNRSPRALLVHQARSWSRVVLAFVAPGFVLAFFDPGRLEVDLAAKSLHLAANLLVVLGAAWHSFVLYVALGPVSQAWQEGHKGRWYRALKEHATHSLAVPDGLVPAVTATGRVFGVGVLALVASAYIGHSAPALALVPGLGLLGWSVGRLIRMAPGYDHAFYATNAFYNEIFRRAGGVHASAREPIPYRAVYWVPRRWAPAVWATLRQLDRKLPLGRFIALGHGLLWVFFLQDVRPTVIVVYLLLFAAAKNGTIFLLATPAFAPFPFRAVRQAPASWLATRFFVNLRWTLLWMLSLLLVAVLDPAFTLGQALLWTGVDVVLALLTAGIVTYGTEFQDRKRYA